MCCERDGKTEIIDRTAPTPRMHILKLLPRRCAKHILQCLFRTYAVHIPWGEGGGMAWEEEWGGGGGLCVCLCVCGGGD